VRWGVGSVIKDRILKPFYEIPPLNTNYLCVNGIAQLKDYTEPAALYYISNMSFDSSLHFSRYRRIDHSSCTEEDCKVYNIQRAEYTPKHMGGCNSCQLVGPAKDMIHFFLEQNLIVLPIIKIVSRDAMNLDLPIEVSVVPHEKGMAFTANTRAQTSKLRRTERMLRSVWGRN
jgi:hypothetical protein